MSVIIRLKKMGARNRSTYRIAVVEKRSKRDGKNIEEIGYYNPLVKPPEVKIENNRLDYWLKNGAKISSGVSKVLKK